MATHRPSLPGLKEMRTGRRAPEMEQLNFSGLVHYLEHGLPSDLMRWHCHEAYELHLIVETSGKLFVGDYIGEFSPGHLVLTGPRLPHNWVSCDYPPEGVALRDMLVQFGHAPIEAAAAVIPELREVMPMLERSMFGIEFFGMGAEAQAALSRIRASTGAARLAEFIRFLGVLAHVTDYRLLSSVKMQSFDDDATLAQINLVLGHITEHYREVISAEQMASMLGMSLSKFSRFFRSATGNSFSDFVNQVRINKACQLLMNTDQYVTNVCYEVGFNNVANFNRRFLQLKGITPREFRRKAEGRFGGGG